MMVIGCGGSGGKVVLGLRRRLEEELERRGWTKGIPEALQFKWIDVPADAEHEPDFGSSLPIGDYIALSSSPIYDDYDRNLTFLAGRRIDRLVGWRPTPRLPVPVTEGAGQMRAVGRAVALSRREVLAESLGNSLGRLAAGRPGLDALAAHLRGGNGADGAAIQGGTAPFVIVVSSLAGGTGAGVFMDVCDVVRSLRPDLANRIFSVLFTAEVFPTVSSDSGMRSNTLAAVAEMLSGYLAVDRVPEPLLGFQGALGVSGMSGPSYPFIVGLQPLGGGAPLTSPAECYRAVTETLLATMLDEELQQDFLAHEVTNFIPNTGLADRATAHAMLNEPPGAAVPTRCGIVSSFGSAKVSVGSARFRIWAQDRLARAVVDYIKEGWKSTGLALMSPAQRETALDNDIIELLVNRDRDLFISRCGLREADDPDGTKHDEVLDGIMPKERMKSFTAELRSRQIAEWDGNGEKKGDAWTADIRRVVEQREQAWLGAFKAEVEQGANLLATTIVEKLAAAVSDSMAKYGLPVTAALVEAARAQCEVAVVQLRQDAQTASEKALVDTRVSIEAAFQALGNGRCGARSDYVVRAMDMGMAPTKWRFQSALTTAGADLLEQAIMKVLGPLISELTQVGRDLTHPSFEERVNSWPNGAGVSELYAPPPSEFCLVPPDEWDRMYRELLEATAASVDNARDLVAAGGFTYGKAANRLTAPEAVQFSRHAWYGRDARPVTVTLALRPSDVLTRTKLWLSDTGHPMGRFLDAGLAEYLARDGRDGPQADHLERLSRFNQALAGALAMAKPLFRISDPVMHTVHPGKKLDVKLSVQKFPFPPDHPARDVVEAVLQAEAKQDGGWCLSNATTGIESVLLMSRLAKAVHPAAVASLYQPIAQRWEEITRQGADHAGAIDGFWKYNRARLLTEAIPLAQPSIDAIVKDGSWVVCLALLLLPARPHR